MGKNIFDQLGDDFNKAGKDINRAGKQLGKDIDHIAHAAEKAASEVAHGVEQAAKFVANDVLAHPLAAIEVAAGTVLVATGIGAAIGVGLIAKGGIELVKGAIEEATPKVAPPPPPPVVPVPPPVVPVPAVSALGQTVTSQSGALPSDAVGTPPRGESEFMEFVDRVESDLMRWFHR